MSTFSLTVYRTASSLYLRRGEDFFELENATLDELFTREDPGAWLREALAQARPAEAQPWLVPIQSQEVWAAGVTYRRSRDARMVESEGAGGGSFYDRVYDAARPEVFFKATPHRTVGPGGALHLRSDSHWNVPEPEVALALTAAGQIFGYTIGNDMSSRDIEGQNPLYLPQAKTYRACCALGPGIVVRDEPLPPQTGITIVIERDGKVEFEGKTGLDRMKRTFPDLAHYLFLDNDFPAGAFLLTGTGIVPPTDFTLHPGDLIRISVDGLGTLENGVTILK
jgi:2-dehydro-3-deoxy-D-arabinonate dehydratase